LSELARRSRRGLAAPFRSPQRLIVFNHKRTNLKLERLEEIGPPSYPLASLGLPAITGALFDLGYYFDPLPADRPGDTSYSTISALVRPEQEQQNSLQFEDDSPMQLVERYFQPRTMSDGSFNGDADAVRPDNAVPPAFDDLADSLDNQHDADDPNGTVKPKEFPGSGGASAGDTRSVGSRPPQITASYAPGPSVTPQPIAPTGTVAGSASSTANRSTALESISATGAATDSLASSLGALLASATSSSGTSQTAGTIQSQAPASPLPAGGILHPYTLSPNAESEVGFVNSSTGFVSEQAYAATFGSSIAPNASGQA
jgi:hypothetical protein